MPSGSKDASLLFITSINTSDTFLVSGAAGETGVTLGINYPLKVAAFDPALPGCICPAADKFTA